MLAKEDIANCQDIIEGVRMAQLRDGPDVAALAGKLRAINERLTVAVRLPLSPAAADRIVELNRAGLKVFQLCADQHGRERLGNGRPGRHIKDALREVHGRLVKEGLRDEITLIVSGGIALAEHMAKAIICGADLVAVDTALLVALGCRVCRDAHPRDAEGEARCGSAELCPAETDSVDCAYATQRMVNLMGAWHSQLIEVLGAMGIREVRRLRGEVGRAIFMEDIEKEAFGDLCRVPRSAGERMTASDAAVQVPFGSARRSPIPRRATATGPSKAWPARSGPRPTATATPWASTRSTARRPAPPAGGASRSARTACTASPPATRLRCGRTIISASAPAAPKPPESCVAQCPQKALTVRPNPSAECMGDPRWSSDLILSTWHQAATGRAAPPHLESRTGASGGGFDSLRFKFEVPGFEQQPRTSRRERKSTRGWT